MHDM
jgi:hypothetical protein